MAPLGLASVMSRRVVRYEGEGNRRKPIYSDPLEQDLDVNPPGPIERRQATDEERNGFTPRIAGAGLETTRRQPFSSYSTPTDDDRAATRLTPEERQRRSRDRQIAHGHRPALGSRDHMQQSRLRGAARHVEVLAARNEPLIRIGDPPIPPPSLEEPSVSIDLPPAAADPSNDPEPDPRHEALEELQSAALAAQETLSAREAAAREWERAGEAWDAARDRLNRAQDTVARWFREPGTSRPAEDRRDTELARDPGPIEPERADDALETVTSPASTMATFAATRAALAGGGVELSPSQERVLAALSAAGGNFADAAAALGTPVQSVATALRHIGEKGGIPIELIPMLPAAYAKYRPAGL